MRHARWNGKQLFARVLRKYGLENFTFRVLATAQTQREADDLEKQFIVQYHTRIPNGYNVSRGGHELTRTALRAMKRKRMREELIIERYFKLRRATPIHKQMEFVDV